MVDFTKNKIIRAPRVQSSAGGRGNNGFAPVKMQSANSEPAQPREQVPEWFQPIQNVSDFIYGTIIGTLNGLAKYAKMGAVVGVAMGLAAGIMATAGFTPLLLSYLVTGFAAGMVGGAATGSLLGLCTGGMDYIHSGDPATKHKAFNLVGDPDAKNQGTQVDLANQEQFDIYQDKQQSQQSQSWAERINSAPAKSESPSV
jgi:hypothetical protein